MGYRTKFIGSMQIKVNGETRQLDAPLSLAALAAELNLKPTQVAIERNLEIVPRSRYGETMLTDGDEIEIVQFIGGG
jgi:thiamine biosynthesis protein ThiS